VSEPLLEVRGLRTVFPEGDTRLPVVDDVDLSLSGGETLALVGESGSGKSMTALSILRLVPRPGRIEAGRLRLAGRDVRALPVRELRSLRGREAAMIFQEPMTSLNPVMRCGDQVAEGLRLHERLAPRAARQRVLELFDQVGIPDPAERLDAYPHELSGGLKQRVMIAMALASRPRLLIADEPTTALDVTIQAQILELLARLRAELGMAILLITHDLGIVNELADRVAVMYAGRLVETGTREEVLASGRHPYTQGLLRSIPARAPRGARLAEIPGVVPPPREWGHACRFADRCPLVMAVCRRETPRPVVLSPSHVAHCFALEPGAGRGAR
jgi:oligopeptide/dipeptide ABC transporter ATP-binding protein